PAALPTFPTRRSSDLYEGTTKTTTEGKAGSKEIVYAEKLVDGEVTESEVVSEEVVAEPVTKVVAEGTKEKPAPKPAPEPEKSSSDRKSTRLNSSHVSI